MLRRIFGPKRDNVTGEQRILHKEELNDRYYSGFGGAEVACWLLIPKFAGSNPAEAVGFLKGDKESSARLPSEGK